MKLSLAFKVIRYRLKQLNDKLFGPATTHEVRDPGAAFNFVIVTVYNRNGSVKIVYQVRKKSLRLPASRS